MRVGEIVAYGIGTLALLAGIECLRRMDVLDLDNHGKICPDPPSEVARMFEINKMFYPISPSVAIREHDLDDKYHRTETAITIGDILMDIELEMKYRELLKEYNTLAVSSGEEAVEYLNLCSNRYNQMNYLILLTISLTLPLAIGYNVGYEMTKNRKEKEKKKKRDFTKNTF